MRQVDTNILQKTSIYACAKLIHIYWKKKCNYVCAELVHIFCKKQQCNYQDSHKNLRKKVPWFYHDFSRPKSKSPDKKNQYLFLRPMYQFVESTRTTRMPAFWDTPCRLMITHTSDSHHIPSQNKTKQDKLQSLKNCQKFKFWNCARILTCNTFSEVAW